MSKYEGEWVFPEERNRDPRFEQALDMWVALTLWPIQTINRKHTSYGLKHMCERDIGHYVSDEDMKAALLRAGFRAEEPSGRHWHFNVSGKALNLRELRENIWERNEGRGGRRIALFQSFFWPEGKPDRRRDAEEHA